MIDTHFRIRLSPKNFTFCQNTIFSNINMIYNRCTSKYNRNEVDEYLEEFDWKKSFEVYTIVCKFYGGLFRVSFEIPF